MTNPRQPVYDAFSGLSDELWILLLRVIQPVNLFVGNVVADNPAPCVRLHEAIEAEAVRLRAE